MATKRGPTVAPNLWRAPGLTEIPATIQLSYTCHFASNLSHPPRPEFVVLETGYYAVRVFVSVHDQNQPQTTVKRLQHLAGGNTTLG